MGSKISIDKHASNIEDILEMNPKYFSKIKFDNKISDSITQHIKIWRYYEVDKKSRNIKSEPITLQNIQSSNFTFCSNECYLVLFIYQKDNNESSSFVNFPHSMWGIVESYSNLTPRGLEVPAATSESAHVNILESFLIPKKISQVEESQFEYMIFVWNGKTSNSLLRSLTLSAAFDFESLLNKAKDPLLHVLFSGGVFRNKKLQKGTILQLNSHVSTDANKDYEKQFNAMRQTIYLFKFLFNSADDKKQNTKNFNNNFLAKCNGISNTNPINRITTTTMFTTTNRIMKNPDNINTDGNNINHANITINPDNDNANPINHIMNCHCDNANPAKLFFKEDCLKTEPNELGNDQGAQDSVEDIHGADNLDDEEDDANSSFDEYSNINNQGFKLPELSLSIANNINNNINNNNENLNGQYTSNTVNENNIENMDQQNTALLNTHCIENQGNNNMKITKPLKFIVPNLKLGEKNHQGNNLLGQNEGALKISFDLQKRELIESKVMLSQAEEFNNDTKKLNKVSSSSMGLNDIKKLKNIQNENAFYFAMQNPQNLQSRTQIKSLPLGNIKDQDQARILTYEHIAKEIENGEINENIRETQRKKLKMDHFAQICNEVLPDFLYVGGEQIAYNCSLLKDIGITHIINCAADLCENKFTHNFDYLSYYLKDQRVENIECIFYDSINYIDQCLKNNGKVLVHCVQGVSRSVTICVAYLIYKFRYTYDEAFDKIKKARPVASPNMGFIVQLIMFQKRLLCPYDALPGPRVFCVGSHQKETPLLIVCRLLLDQLYERKNTKRLDPRTAFIIQAEDKIYLWIGKSINPVNKNLYLKAATNFIKILQQNENAPQNFDMIHQEDEPKEFWSLWLKEPEIKYESNFDWDPWFIDVSKHANLKGPTYDRNKESEEDRVEIHNNPNLKPFLYCFPDQNPLHIFDIDDLSDENFMVICSIKDGIKTAYIWRGINFDKQIDEQAYIEAVIKFQWPNDDIKMIKQVHEIPHQESEEFLDLFTLRD